MRAERPNDHPRGPADVLERASLAQELRGDEEALAHYPGPVREARRRPNGQSAPDDTCGPGRHGAGRLVEGPCDVRYVRVARVVDRRPDADHDQVQPVPGDFRTRHDPPGAMLARVRFGQPWLVERDAAVGQRRQAVGVLFD